MFNILIVEDNTDKLREIIQLLSTIENIDVDLIDSELDAISAKKRLKVKAYDFLILDIAIPNRKADQPDLEGGLKLLNEILNRKVYKIPTHIIGLTAKEEIFEKASKTFEEKLLFVIRYSNIDIEWKTKLFEGIKQRINAKDSEYLIEPDYDYDIAIVCALKKELDANKNNGWKWENFPLDKDDTNYYIGTFNNSSGKEIRVIAAQTARMGMAATASLAMKLVTHFRPKYIFMTGIMARFRGYCSSKSSMGLG